MELFIPNILAVPKTSAIAPESRGILTESDISAPAGSEFQKVYFEELAKRCYKEEGGFESLSRVARVHYEEYYGAGGASVKRWKIHFSKYNVSLNLEETGGKLIVKAS